MISIIAVIDKNNALERTINSYAICQMTLKDLRKPH